MAFTTQFCQFFWLKRLMTRFSGYQNVVTSLHPDPKGDVRGAEGLGCFMDTEKASCYAWQAHS